MSLGRVAELAWALGLNAELALLKDEVDLQANHPQEDKGINIIRSVQSSTSMDIIYKQKELNRVIENV